MRRSTLTATAVLSAVATEMILLGGCTQQPDPQSAAGLAAIQTQLTQVQGKLDQVESQVSQLTSSSASSGDWVLWASWDNLHNSLSFGWPTAQSAYSTKESCLAQAADHSFTHGKTTVVSLDPYIIQNGTEEWTYRCLPKGIKPLLGK